VFFAACLALEGRLSEVSTNPQRLKPSLKSILNVRDESRTLQNESLQDSVPLVHISG